MLFGALPCSCTCVLNCLCIYSLHLSPCSTIPDEDAVKPEGWLDEEPAELDDPGKLACSRQSCVLLCRVAERRREC